MNKKKFPEVVAQFDYQNSTGCTMKSLYGNVVHGNSDPHLNGEKVTIFRPMTLEQVKERVANRQFIAFNDDGLRPGLKHWLMENFPDRFWDVAIAEQHAITSMAAMAKEGFKPYITIYSTFLQRGFDQIIHDVCLMNLPVVFAMDRAGMVGNDGETHQGVFDISFLRFIPNMILFAPRDNETLIQGLEFAYTLTSPSAIRYPRGYFKELVYNSTPFTLGKAELLKDGSSNKLFIGYGAGVSRAIDTEVLHGEDIAILDLRFVKPIDKNILIELSKKYDNWYVFSDSQKQGGVASAILEVLNDEKIHNIQVITFEYADSFIEHGETKQVEESLGLLPEQLVLKVK